MLELTQDIGSNLKTCGQKAAGVSIMIRDNSLYTKQWQCKLNIPTQSAFTIASRAYELFLHSYKWENQIRSITVTAINLVDLNESAQLDLFTDYSKMERQEVLENCVETLRSRFGKNIILPAAILDNKKTQINPVKLIMPRGLSGTGAMV
jgi:DNA polymerase-4